MIPEPTGIHGLDQVLIWGGVVSLLFAVGAGVWRLVGAVVRFAGRVDHLIDDWRGEPARPGVTARLGVMERIAGIEEQVGELDRRLQGVEHELHPNEGASLRDAVDLANCRLERLARLLPDSDGNCPPPGMR
ncbi:hypothetical protein [Streptomyces sp. NPDC059063]|uniref:hypothetical protein n=1 Tax=Streptomyces sp. NPDC059063 TaxID=3346712 RepID=UPI0036CE3484